MPRTVVGLYNDIGTARELVQDLVDHGFEREDIGLIAYDVEEEYAPHVTEERVEVTEPETEDMAEGAGIGAILGGLAGLLVGLGALVVPGVGPVVAAGSIATTLMGAGVGAAAGGLIGALVDAGVAEEEAELYAEGVRRGGTLVTAEVHNNRVDEATEIFESYEPVDVKHRSARWRKEGWTGYDPDATPLTPSDLQEEHEYWRTQTVGREPIRRREATDYGDIFRDHYEETFARSGYPYEQYEPAYVFGYQLAAEPGYRDTTWDEVEPEARRRWEEEDEGVWDDFEDAIQAGWNEMKEALDVDTDFDYESAKGGFRRHYEEVYADTDHPFERYEPGYEYGYGVATESRYRGLDWEEAAPRIRARWEERSHGPWEEFEDAIREGWKEVKLAFEGQKEYEDYAEYEPEIRRHYERTYIDSGYNFDYYEPGYRYGYGLAFQPAYQGVIWDDVREEVMREWEERNEGSWEDVEESVRYGWNLGRRGAI